METIEEEEEDGRMKITMFNVTTAKSLDILLANVTSTRMIHNKMKQSLQGKKMMKAHY